MILDLIRAHRKAILTLVGLLAIQYVDSETADWLIAAVDTALVIIVGNDPDAKARIYDRRR